MIYRIAGIDVHKKMLAVAVADVGGAGEYQFERRTFGATPDQLRALAQWLIECGVQEVGDGIDGAILEAGLGSAGTALETGLRETARRQPDVGRLTSGAGQVESSAGRA